VPLRKCLVRKVGAASTARLGGGKGRDAGDVDVTIV
jgi:hypothetical protein